MRGPRAQEEGRWSADQCGKVSVCWCATGPVETSQIGLHRLILGEDGKGLAQDFSGPGIRGDLDLVVHPFAFPARGDYAGPAQVGEMAGDFRLALV